jgi:hypothetical protein
MIVDNRSSDAGAWQRPAQTGAESMRRILLVGLVVLCGCPGLQGPRARQCNPEVVADPCLSTTVQEMRGRDRLALPEPSNDVAPRTYAENPAYKGRIAQ